MVHLSRPKELVDEFDSGPQKRHVGEAVLVGGFGAPPKTVALDVHPNEVPVGPLPCKPHRVLPLATPQFEGDGVVVAKHLAVPLALVRVFRALHGFLEVWLEDVVHLGVFLPLPKFAFAHGL